MKQNYPSLVICLLITCCLQVLDISSRFCDYLQSIGFGDLEICSYKETEVSHSINLFELNVLVVDWS